MITRKNKLQFGILVHRNLSKKDLKDYPSLMENLESWKVYNMTVGINKIPTEVTLLVPNIEINKSSILMTSELAFYKKQFNKIDNCGMVFYDIKQLFKNHTPKLDLFLVPENTHYFKFSKPKEKMTVQMSHGEDGNTWEMKTGVNIG